MFDIDLRKHNNQKTIQLINYSKNIGVKTCVWGAGGLAVEYGKKVITDLGMTIDYFCDNNRNLWGKEILPEIYCCDYQRLKEDAENVVCILTVRCDWLDIVYRQIRDLGISNIILLDDLVYLTEGIHNYFPFMNKGTVIYTCIVDDYDDLKEPKYISEGCDYVLLSDKKPKDNGVFQFIDVKDVVPEDIRDSHFINRYCKINADKIFPKYRYSIYMDGGLEITGDICKCTEHLNQKTGLGVAGENYYDSVFVEILKAAEGGRIEKEKAMEISKRYWNEGMPMHFVSFLCNVLVRQHNHPVCKKIMHEWWEETYKHTYRDQISLPYILWKNGIMKEDIYRVCENGSPWNDSPYWNVPHGHKKGICPIKHGLG
jgi:hypothetical protein